MRTSRNHPELTSESTERVQAARGTGRAAPPGTTLPNSAVLAMLTDEDGAASDRQEAEQALAGAIHERIARLGGATETLEESATPARVVLPEEGEGQQRSHRSNVKFQHFLTALDAYKTEGGTLEQELALLGAAGSYIRKHGHETDENHLAQSAQVEDALYELTMRGDTAKQANENIDHIRSIMSVEESAKEKTDTVKRLEKKALETLKSIYNPTKSSFSSWGKRQKPAYSKALQLITADVMSQQGNIAAYFGGWRSYTTKLQAEEAPDGGRRDSYEVYSRATSDVNDTLGTSLHEFTHVANSIAYDNSGLFLTYEPGTSPEKVEREMRWRKGRLRMLKQLSGEEPPECRIGCSTLKEYVEGRTDYGGDWKSRNQYIPVRMKWLNAEERKRGHTPFLTEDRQKVEAFKDIVEPLFQQGKIGEQARKLEEYRAELEAGEHPVDSKSHVPVTPQWIEEQMRQLDESCGGSAQALMTLPEEISPDTMIEYDSVINQMLVQYEASGGNKASKFYQALKASALDAFVRRRMAALKRQIGSGR